MRRIIEKSTINNLTEYRSLWMALAILWIFFYHTGAAFKNPVINALRATGYGGGYIHI